MSISTIWRPAGSAPRQVRSLKPHSARLQAGILSACPNWRRPPDDERLDRFSILALPPHYHHRPVGDGGFRTLRRVATQSAAVAPAMGIASRCGWRSHAGNDVADLRSVHSPERPAVLE